MSTILTSDAAYDHEGYAAHVLDDGTITGTYSSETRRHMIGYVVAACECGWTGTTRYPSPQLIDEHADELALAEWEHTHARPVLERHHQQRRDQLTHLAAITGRSAVAGLVHAIADYLTDYEANAVWASTPVEAAEHIVTVVVPAYR